MDPVIEELVVVVSPIVEELDELEDVSDAAVLDVVSPIVLDVERATVLDVDFATVLQEELDVLLLDDVVLATVDDVTLTTVLELDVVRPTLLETDVVDWPTVLDVVRPAVLLDEDVTPDSIELDVDIVWLEQLFDVEELVLAIVLQDEFRLELKLDQLDELTLCEDEVIVTDEIDCELDELDDTDRLLLEELTDSELEDEDIDREEHDDETERDELEDDTERELELLTELPETDVVMELSEDVDNVLLEDNWSSWRPIR